ncbi:MAG: SemiSWEET transporter [Ignavibacteria bacterium]|nr:SemiSWEET transporter [Ignavibacteria bacterium]MBK6771934.1 SemiSWEET transporter [Ignavibacteria bacterium]MBK7444691.1 SemiSWEET transporter [Ignavibacteria bacterium]MBK8382159.1 SemiSWEET transporter [Ignavibacteria bacterium]MBK9403677.1 SemiSWEET transporter [Ignavibacteria bacterium]
MNTNLIIGLVAASLTTFAFLPQSIRAIKTKHTKDLSLPTLIMLEIGIVIWIIYGFLISDIPLLAANTISFIFMTVTLRLKLKYG